MAADTIEIKARLVAALQTHFQQNWQTIAPGETISEQDLESRAKAYAEWYAKEAVVDPSTAVTADGGLTSDMHAAIDQNGPTYYANYKASLGSPSPILAHSGLGDIGTNVIKEAGAVPQTLSGEKIQPRTLEAGAPAQPAQTDKKADAQQPATDKPQQAEGPEETPEGQKTEAGKPAGEPATDPAAPAETLGATPPDETAPTDDTPPQDSPAETPPSEAAPADSSAAAAAAAATAATPREKYDWTNVQSIYAPYSYSPENEVGNGNATGSDVHKVTDEKFYALNYNTMRQLAVYYGGYERDPKFHAGIESFAAQQGIAVDDLIDPDSAYSFKKDENTPPLGAQHVLHQIYEQQSLLLGNPLRDDPNASAFRLQLTEAGLVKKPFLRKLFMNEDVIRENTNGSEQFVHGSIVVFKDAAGSMYGDDGEKVFMKMGANEQFGAEHSINMARIYMSARQNPTGNENLPQRMKYSIGSGLGKFIGEAASKMKGIDGEYARRRDLMILGALHQGKLANIKPDLFEKNAWGREKAIGELSMDKLSPSAVSAFEKLGIDVQQLLDHHNGKTLSMPSVSGEAAVRRIDATPVTVEGETAEPGSAHASINQPEAKTPITIDEIAGTDTRTLADKLTGTAAPDYNASSSATRSDIESLYAATRRATLGARLLQLGTDPKTALQQKPIKADAFDPEDVKADMQELKAHTETLENGEQIQTPAEHIREKGAAHLEAAAKTFEDMGLKDVADGLRQSLTDYNKPKQSAVDPLMAAGSQANVAEVPVPERAGGAIPPIPRPARTIAPKAPGV